MMLLPCSSLTNNKTGIFAGFFIEIIIVHDTYKNYINSDIPETGICRNVRIEDEKEA